MPLRSHSIEDYRRYLRDHLPEYSLRDAVLPEPGRGRASCIYLVLGDQSVAKYGVLPAPPHPVQPALLEITGGPEGKKRMTDLQHFVNKRNKIVKFLSENAEARAAGYVLREYRRWDDFSVGLADRDDATVKYQHLAALKKAVEKLKDPTQRDWFRLRRFFHMTTLDQKRQMVINLLAVPPAIYELDTTKPFDKNRFVIKFRDPARAPNYRLTLTSYSELCEQVTGYQNNILGYVTQQMNAIASKLHEKYILPQEVAQQVTRMRAEAPESMRLYIQVDSLQKKFVTAHQAIIDKKRSLLHTVFKSAKQALVGKHVRTHPLRTLRIVTGHLLAGVSAIVAKVESIKVPPPEKTTAQKMLEEVDALVQSGTETVATVVAEEAAAKIFPASPTPQWLTDLGWGTTPIEEDKAAWESIGEHLNSLEKWEGRMKSALHVIGNGDPASRPVTCDQVDEVIQAHAKILYHLGTVKDEFKTQVDFFSEMVSNLELAKNRLAASEDGVKLAVAAYEAKTNEAYRLIENMELEYYRVVDQMAQRAVVLDQQLLAGTVMPADVDRVVDFVQDAEEA